jgi:hypothetical protein
MADNERDAGTADATNWSAMYWLVLVAEALVIATLYGLTRLYS